MPDIEDDFIQLFDEDNGDVNETETNDTETQETETNDTDTNTTSPEVTTDDEFEKLFNEQDTGEEKSDTNSKTNNKTKSQKQKSVNNSKDLIDENGNVIAKAGAERRFYEENQKLKREQQQFVNEILPTIREQYGKMETELANYKGVIEGLKASDLTPQELQGGIDFVRSWKKDPQNVVKFLLTSLQSSGMDIDIEGLNNQTQMAAIKDIIDKKFEPFMKEREEAEKARKLEEDVTNSYNNFIKKYPDSVIHDKTLAFMIKKDPNLTPEVAYLQLKNYYLQNGLDFKVPLEAYAQNNNKNVQQRTVPNIGNTPRIPSTVQVDNNISKISNINDSYRDIIKNVMNENGINY